MRDVFSYIDETNVKNRFASAGDRGMKLTSSITMRAAFRKYFSLRLLAPAISAVLSIAMRLSRDLNATVYPRSRPLTAREMAIHMYREVSKMNFNTQNTKIAAITEKTLIVVIDVGSETHFARAFDWRKYEYSKNPLKKMQSMIAVACKLIRIFYKLLTTGESYDGEKEVRHDQGTSAERC